MADEGHLGQLGGAGRQLAGLLEREDVLELLQVERRAVAEGDLAVAVLVGQAAQPLQVPGGSRPACRSSAWRAAS